ncbi:hypothetical protein EVAR_707_1 [Eumeta japonica]|uniref:Uncharacterized protein n=1 Tax=Eumeta variegata TaxID=151549 RepID=A0A4C1SCG7_EUMVA|nr:hypothetical protein EVAR_707_1 [Eumeta japonica]
MLLRKKGMKVNVSANKIMVCEKNECTTECDIYKIIHLSSLFTNDGKHDRDIESDPDLTHGSKSSVWRKKNNCGGDATLRNIYEASLKDKCGNSDLRERSGLKEDVVT